jgi:hypothetical protein
MLCCPTPRRRGRAGILLPRDERWSASGPGDQRPGAGLPAGHQRSRAQCAARPGAVREQRHRSRSRPPQSEAATDARIQTNPLDTHDRTPGTASRTTYDAATTRSSPNNRPRPGPRRIRATRVPHLTAVSHLPSPRSPEPTQTQRCPSTQQCRGTCRHTPTGLEFELCLRR